MKKRPRVAVLNTMESTRVNLIQDSNEWGIVKTDAGKELLLGMYRIGKLLRVESFDPAAEVRQLVTIGTDATPEVIVASTRYKIEIGNPDDRYESQKRGPAIHAYTSAATLSGNAATDRTNVYVALAAKINAYAGNNVTAHLLFQKAYTLGGATGNETPIVGELCLETTSAATARIIAWTITSGTFGAGDAAGIVWFAHISGVLSAVTKTWTYGSSSSTLSGTDAPVLGQGLAIEDDAGYFISNISRAGTNWVGATQGWIVSVAAIALVGAYAQGIGSVMAQLIPRYDHSKQQVISGFLEYELQAGDAFDTAKTYRKYVFVFSEGDEDSMGGTVEKSESNAILYCDFADTSDLSDLDTAISALT